jgi:cellulose synthase/poly-beta-1,6-N-acetylglucosamine synthase-like glycosyltransferase
MYDGSSTITGALRSNRKVLYTSILSRTDQHTLVLFLVLILLAATSLIGLLLSALLFTGFGILLLGLLLLVAVVEGIRIIQGLTLLIYARYAQDPVPMEPEPNLRIAVLTTIVPGKEPFELVAHTLRQMKKLEHEPGTKVDVWLLDEGNDTYVRRQCYAMGVKHFSRKGIKEFNTTSGEFKARTKHGNHNA